jgi:ATP-dependent RNA helicase DeaD
MGFTKMGLNPKLVEGLKVMGITTPTPIQAKCIPEIKAGKDVVGQSLTGSGKTAAFGLPILEKIVPGAGLQALILVPTRELCVQVRDNLEAYAKFLPINIISVYGGVGFYQQMEEIKFGEVIVATPGRLLDHMGRRNISLKNLKFVVLDEADRMFDMGFEDDVDKILRQTPNSRQTIMFSATMEKSAQNMIVKYLKNPVYIKEQLQVDRSLLKQIFYSVRKNDKFALLVHLLKNKTSGPAIVFCGTKREVDKVSKHLRKLGIEALPVHGDLTQGKRQFAVNSFKNAKIDVLVATDVAARGLDIKDVSHVYNYDVPRTSEEYTHRIGRTARAGKKGDAITLLSERDYNNFNKILRFGKMDIKQETLPEFEKIEFSRDDFSGRNDGFERRDFGRRDDRRPRDNFSSNRSFDSRPKRASYGGSSYGGQNNYEDNRSSYQHHDRRISNSWTNESSNSQDNRSSYPRERSHFQRREYSQGGFGRGSNSSRPSFGNNYSRPIHRGNENRSHRDYSSRPSYNNERSPQAAYSQTQSSEQRPANHERTPRTAEPLFPTSHYNPDHKAHKPRRENASNKERNTFGEFKSGRKAVPTSDRTHKSSSSHKSREHFEKHRKRE